MLAFEVISLLLLAAVIGGIYLARRDTIPDPSESVDALRTPPTPEAEAA